MEFSEVEDLIDFDPRFDHRLGPRSSQSTARRLLMESLAFGRLDAQSSGWDPFYLMAVVVGDVSHQIVTLFPERFAHIGLTPAVVANLLHEDAGSSANVDLAAHEFFRLMREMHEDRRGRVEGTGALVLPRDIYSSGELVIPLLVSISPRILRAYEEVGVNASDRLQAFGVHGDYQDHLMRRATVPLS